MGSETVGCDRDEPSLITAPFWAMKTSGKAAIDTLCKEHQTIRALCGHLLKNTPEGRDLLLWILSRPGVLDTDARARLVYRFLKPFEYMLQHMRDTANGFQALESYVQAPANSRMVREQDIRGLQNSVSGILSSDDTLLEPAVNILKALVAYKQPSDLLFVRISNFEYLMGLRATEVLNQALAEVRNPFQDPSGEVEGVAE